MNTSLVLGIDPGKSFLAAWLMQSTGERVWKARQFDMSREGFERLKADIPEGELTIGVEASGRIDDNLLAWLAEWQATCPQRKIKLIRVNPGQSARFGGPKPRRDQTDGSDSEHIAEYTRVYAHRLDAFEHDPQVQAMVRLVAERQHVVEHLAATKNRIHEQLLVCFPEFTRVFKDPFAKLASAVLREVPTAQRAAGRKPLSLARVKTGRKERSLGVLRAGQLIQLAKRSIASAGEENDAEAMIFLLDQIELLEKRLERIKQILVDFADQARKETEASGEEGISPARQMQLLDSIPGIAVVAAATLVLGTRGLTRFHTNKALAAQWASCPERTQTGTSLDKTRLTARGDHKRRAMLYLATQIACLSDPAFAFHKWRMIQGGLRPQQAICATMNRMARIIWAVVAHNQPYDAHRMLEQIRIHHATQWKTFVLQHGDKAKLWKNVAPEYRKIA
jgi:transposase